MSARVELRMAQDSPRAPYDQCDLVLVRRGADGTTMVLVVDGSPGRVTARPARPRERLFAVVRDCWRGVEPPADLLHRIDQTLVIDRAGQPWRMAASAVALQIDAAGREVVIAQAGDTSAWIIEAGKARALFKASAPAAATAPAGMLGEEHAQIRTQAVPGHHLRSLAILTDGAYHRLVRAGWPTVTRDAFEDTLRTVGGHDDATVVRVDLEWP
jgi:hypothetical protein